MDRFIPQSLVSTLAQHKTIGIDSVIFIYQIEAHPLYQPLAGAVLSGVVDGQYAGVTSVITLMEITVHPWRANLEMVAREYETLLVHFPNLQLVEITRSITRQAARLRARLGLRTPDALQIAAALEQGATAFVTNDHELRRASPLIKVIVVGDYVRG